MKLKNQKALITGATSGIGKATAYKLLELGCDVILLARREERLIALKTEWLKEFPDRSIHTLQADLQDLASLDKSLLDCANILRGLTILINNAGLAKGTSPVQSAQWDDWNQMIQTNFVGLTFLTQKVLPNLLSSSGSHIVNLGSIAGRWVYPGGAIYCATKFAVRAFSEGLRMDLLGKNVRVTNIEPGMVETEFSMVRFDGDHQKAKQLYSGMTPLLADDIAECITWSLLRPPHVNIQEMVIYPTEQASSGHIFRSNSAN